MATTTNYSWTTPDDTDLVKDGAAAIRTLGSAIDTTVFTNAGNAVQKATIDAKGDLLVGTANDTISRLAIGTDGAVLTADSAETSGVKWAVPASGFVGVSCYKSGNSQTIANSTATAITWDAENFDTDAFHDTSTNTSRITIPSGKGGKYLIMAMFKWDDNTTGNDRATYIYKNGVSAGALSTSVAAGYYPTAYISTIYDLVATDYLEIFVFQTSGGNRDIYANNANGYFIAQYLGA